MKKIIQSLFLLIIGLALVGVVYGGVGVFKEVKANDSINENQSALSREISDLKNLIENQNQTIADLQNELSNVKKIASAPKIIAGASTPPPMPAPEPQVITQTVTKTVVVKEEPEPTASITIEGLGSYNMEVGSADTAFGILQEAAAENGFALEFQKYEFGVFVTAIGGVKPSGNKYWAFYYNGKYSQVGASDQMVKEGDSIYWKLDSF